VLFNSYIFIFLFLPITLFGYFFLNRINARVASKCWLVFCSIFFYGYFNFSFLWIILSSVIVNYLFSMYFEKSKENKSIFRKFLFIVGLIFNIGLLFIYKYLDFVFEIASNLFSIDLIYMGLTLPLGISFFTFQQVSYLVDSYKGTAKQYSLLDYSLFVTFFPQLIAGPIVLHNEVIPQFENDNNLNFNAENLSKGLFLFAQGLAKKVIIADNFGKIVSYGYVHIPTLNSFEAILTILAYTLQIYFDFSGYCDMASGIAYMFNIELPINFNSPYKAKTISEFWKRWHITLTRFLTNYVYIPLGGNRKGSVRTYMNILIVFIVSGIWHGAGYTFVLWGALHGIAMLLDRVFKKYISKISPMFTWFATFVFVNITWVFFRADSIKNAIALLGNVFNGGFDINQELTEILLNIIPISIITNGMSLIFSSASDMGLILNICMIVLFFAFIGVCLLFPNAQEKTKKFTPKASNLISTTFLMIWGILSLSGVSVFLYFNF